MRSFIAVAVCVAAVPAFARTLVVRPGQSIQAAVNQASGGDRIVVHPGTYVESASGHTALTITKGRIELVGLSSPNHRVILENAGAQSYGVWVSPANSLHDPQRDDEDPPCAHPETAAVLNGFSIRGFTIRGFATHGVHLACVDGFSIVDNRSVDNRVYGLFPVLSHRGVMAGNVVTGTTNDAAIYVGQSERVLIAGNRVYGNLLGIEIENSGQCAAIANEAYGNTAGILVDLLPHLQRPTLEDTFVAFNSVHDNNLPNVADEGILSVLPEGSGIVVVGGHRTTVLANHVQGNHFTGIGVANYCLVRALQGDPECADITTDVPPIDPFPMDDRIVGNLLENNGTEVPQGNPRFAFFDAIKADLIWDLSGSGNCWSHNRFTTTTEIDLSSGVPVPLHDPGLLPSCK